MARRAIAVLLLATTTVLLSCGDDSRHGGVDNSATPDEAVSSLQAAAWELAATWTVGDQEVSGEGDLDIPNRSLSFALDGSNGAAQLFIEGESYLSPAGPGCDDATPWSPGFPNSETPSLGSTGVIPGYWYDGLLWAALLDSVEWSESGNTGSRGTLDLTAVTDENLTKSVETLRSTTQGPIDVELNYDASLKKLSLALEIPEDDRNSVALLEFERASVQPSISPPAAAELCSVGTLGT